MTTPTKGGRFCLISLLLIVLALGVQFGALSLHSQSMKLRARAVAVAQVEKAALRGQADHLNVRGSLD